MTNPPTPGPNEQPDYSPYQPPTPQFGQPQWTPPVEPPPPAEQPYSLMPPPPAPRRRGKWLAAVTAAVVVAGGGIATVMALSDSSSEHGAASAREAVQNLVSDINDSDVIGMLEALAPPERIALADPLIKDFDQLKRTHVLSSDADLRHLSGAGAKFSGLTFGGNITINDHVQVVQITGGTLRVDTDLSKLPLSSDFLKAIGLEHGLSGTHSATVNIADAVRANHGETIRVAAEKVGGRWYPSLLYTIAYYAVDSSGLPQPSASDAVPAKGADSPVDAVKTLVSALLGGDIPGAIGVTSPSEDAALHDYGGVIIKQVGSSYPAAPVTVDRLELHSTAGPDGTQLVQLDGFSAQVADLGQVSLEIDGDCVRLTMHGGMQRMCVDREMRMLTQMFKQFSGKPLTAAQQQALKDLSSSNNLIGSGGIVTSQVDGKWFVNPIQTFGDGTTSLLQQFQGNDLLELIGLFKQLAQGFGQSMSGSGGGSFCVPAPGQTC